MSSNIHEKHVKMEDEKEQQENEATNSEVVETPAQPGRINLVDRSSVDSTEYRFIIVFQSLLIIAASFYQKSAETSTKLKHLEQFYDVEFILDVSRVIGLLLIIWMHFMPDVVIKSKARPFVAIMYIFCECAIAKGYCHYLISLDWTYYILGIVIRIWQNVYYFRERFFKVERNINKPKIVGNSYTLTLMYAFSFLFFLATRHSGMAGYFPFGLLAQFLILVHISSLNRTKFFYKISSILGFLFIISEVCVLAVFTIRRQVHGHDLYIYLLFFLFKDLAMLMNIYEFLNFDEILSEIRGIAENIIKQDTYWIIILVQIIGYAIYSELYSVDLELLGRASMTQFFIGIISILLRSYVQQFSFLRRILLIAFIGTQILIINPLGVHHYNAFSIFNYLFIAYQVIKSMIVIQDNFVQSNLTAKVTKRNRIKVLVYLSLEALAFYAIYSSNASDYYTVVKGFFSLKTLTYSLILCCFIMFELVSFPFLITKPIIGDVMMLLFAFSEVFILSYTAKVSGMTDFFHLFFPLTLISQTGQFASFYKYAAAYEEANIDHTSKEDDRNHIGYSNVIPEEDF